MSSFANSTFQHDHYATFRPTYSDDLYDTILNYHGSDPTDLALDLGTGHGLVARRLTESFTQVHASDISAGMINSARSLSTDYSNLTFHQFPAESNPFIDDKGVDMVTAAECAHWFDYDRFWPEMARIVRPGGTLAVWAYHNHAMVEYPNATRVLDHYANGMEEELLGPYWPQPGHRILMDQLRAVVPPEGQWRDIQRLEYTPGCGGMRKGKGKGLSFVTGKMTLGTMADYMRTWSSHHEWKKRWPGREKRAVGEEAGEGGRKGDVLDEMIDEMLKAEPGLADRAAAAGRKVLDLDVEIEFNSTLIMARKR